MKAYVITNPEKLKEVAQLMKWQNEAAKVETVAKVWSATSRREPEKAEKMHARIEIGRSAQLFKVIGTSVELLGTIRLPAAKEFVSGLEVSK